MSRPACKTLILNEPCRTRTCDPLVKSYRLGWESPFLYSQSVAIDQLTFEIQTQLVYSLIIITKSEHSP